MSRVDCEFRQIRVIESVLLGVRLLYLLSLLAVIMWVFMVLPLRVSISR